MRRRPKPDAEKYPELYNQQMTSEQRDAFMASELPNEVKRSVVKRMEGNAAEAVALNRKAAAILQSENEVLEAELQNRKLKAELAQDSDKQKAITAAQQENRAQAREISRLRSQLERTTAQNGLAVHSEATR